MNKRVVIVANGRLYKEILDEIVKDDIVIGVDRAAYWLVVNGVAPDVAIGDFDSTTEKELQHIKENVADVRTYPPEKDFTDTELALKVAFSLKPQEIIVFGAMGTRKDHELAAIGLLEQSWKRGIHAVIRDETNEVMLVGRGRTILERRVGSRYISILPITQSIVISLSKFKYEITKKRILRGQTIGVSNEFAGRQAEITMHRGRALIIQSRD